jgi:hypothetical protein
MNGQIVVTQTLEGEVVEVTETDVTARYDTNDDVIEQTYSLSQFNHGRIPVVGEKLVVNVTVTIMPQETDTETKKDKPRRNNITGDHRF